MKKKLKIAETFAEVLEKKIAKNVKKNLFRRDLVTLLNLGLAALTLTLTTLSPKPAYPKP